MKLTSHESIYVEKQSDEWTIEFGDAKPLNFSFSYTVECDGYETEQIHGDLFGCLIDEITEGTEPIAPNSEEESHILSVIKQYLGAKYKDFENIFKIKHVSMTQEQVWDYYLSWFYTRLCERRTRLSSKTKDT